MEENQNENENTFKSVKNAKVKTKNSGGSKILLPFISGILGAALVIGVCFGIPDVRDVILDGKVAPTTIINNNPTGNINSDAISLKGYSETAMGVADKVLPSIVGIKIEYKVNSFFGASTGSATGSGIIISEDGYILTNNHVVSASSGSSSIYSYYEVTDAVSVKVTLYNDETEYDAQIVGQDEETDLAIIKINKKGLTPATLGNSDDVKVGEFVMAVGCPLRLNTTVTSGIISAVNRTVTTQDNQTYKVLQTDAAINSGNSGGALVNSKGEVIGINTLKLSGTGIEGISFAIPISSTTDVVSQLIEYKKVLRPYIGIEGTEVTETMAKKYNLVVGVYVSKVENFTAAQKAGVKVGDVITEVDGKTVTTVEEINEIKNNKNIGDKITLKVYRDKDYQNIELTLEEQP